MSSIQERLQLKRIPLDTWNTREKLCLASAVVRSGDQNWMSVSRSLKSIGEPNRPADWYSQKSCAAQYGALLEHVEIPKRKKRCSEGGVETPQESIHKRLTQERITEIQKTVAELNQQYDLIKNELTEARSPATSEERLREIWSSIEAAARAEEREAARRAAAMQERDQRRSWKPPTPSTPVTPTTPSSPLLTSLLKSSPVVTTPQHISHPANLVETVSPSATAPTLSMLLEKSAANTQHESKHAAIEHIKSQLVQIEHQLKASTVSSPSGLGTPTPTPTAAAVATVAPPAVDIDDIEIKAEDVYAFRDVDIHLAPVTAMHKPAPRSTEKPMKIDEQESETVESITEASDVIKIEPITVVEPEVAAVVETENHTSDVQQVPVESVEEEPPPPEPEVEPLPEVKIAFPEVKFPTTEIKVIQPDEQKVKEEVKEPEVVAPVPEIVEEEVASIAEAVVEEIVTEPAEKTTEITEVEAETIETLVADVVQEIPDPETIPLPPEPEVVHEEVQNTPEVPVEPPLPPEPDVPPPEEQQEEPAVEVKLEKPEVQTEEATEPVKEELIEESTEDSRNEDAEDSIPLKEMIKEELMAAPEPEARAERPPEVDEPHTETDDDTPMELSREEEKDGKKKRDYSRKKKSDSRTCSGSESAPESPAPDAERQHRLWRKSVMLVYSRLCAHKYASLFVRPISDEEAPGYSVVVRRPMDLSTIRKNIDNGTIRTTAQFQRDILLMLTNALMYNSSEHSVYAMAKEMHQEASSQLSVLLAAQAHASLSGAPPPPPPPPRRKRRRADSPQPTPKRHA